MFCLWLCQVVYLDLLFTNLSFKFIKFFNHSRYLFLLFFSQFGSVSLKFLCHFINDFCSLWLFSRLSSFLGSFLWICSCICLLYLFRVYLAWGCGSGSLTTGRTSTYSCWISCSSTSSGWCRRRSFYIIIFNIFRLSIHSLPNIIILGLRMIHCRLVCVLHGPWCSFSCINIMG